MQRVTCNRLTYHSSDLIQNAGGAVHGFSTRLGGVSKGDCAELNLSLTRGDDPTCVFENYRLFCAAIGADSSKIAKTRQVHADHIRIVETPGAESEEDADGLITNIPGIALTVFYADCIPILLYDPNMRVIAAVHAGWRGTALGIVDKAVDMMSKRYASNPNDI
ncbi:MAG: polyphenol oxidase family protein, partial [Evtepia sp.]